MKRDDAFKGIVCIKRFWRQMRGGGNLGWNQSCEVPVSRETSLQIRFRTFKWLRRTSMRTDRRMSGLTHGRT